ncbi:hypothetical protein RDI58_011856 [Solanum bulbocastanum]|uniref:Uncharacterized protein n=1 Tax=Solanum bulbocastanum TaxID=147425 RepID=A0AAN8YHF5_SOLBU
MNYAMPFSPNLQRDDDAVASSIMTKLLSESKKEPIENKKLDVDDEEDVKGLDDERTIHTMNGLDSKTVISSSKGDGLRGRSFIYFVDIGTEFHFRKNTIYVAMLTLHKFLQKKCLKLLLYAYLCLAEKMRREGIVETFQVPRH